MWPQESEQSTWVGDAAAEQGYVGIGRGKMGFLVHGIACIETHVAPGCRKAHDSGEVVVKPNKNLARRLAAAICAGQSSVDHIQESNQGSDNEDGATALESHAFHFDSDSSEADDSDVSNVRKEAEVALAEDALRVDVCKDATVGTTAAATEAVASSSCCVVM